MNCRTLYPCFSILLALVASADEPQSDSTLLPVSVVKPVEFVDGTFAGETHREVDGDVIEERLFLVRCGAPEGSASIKQTRVMTGLSASVSCSTVRPFLSQKYIRPLKNSWTNEL